MSEQKYYCTSTLVPYLLSFPRLCHLRQSRPRRFIDRVTVSIRFLSIQLAPCLKVRPSDLIIWRFFLKLHLYSTLRTIPRIPVRAPVGEPALCCGYTIMCSHSQRLRGPSWDNQGQTWDRFLVALALCTSTLSTVQIKSTPCQIHQFLFPCQWKVGKLFGQMSTA